MTDAPDQLFRWHPDVESTSEPVSTLILTVTAFGDAGHAQNHLRQSFLGELTHQELGEFDLDSVLDHRDSRSAIIFDEDHFTEYQRPRMVLSELTDELGQHFLLLDGPEPALRWEAMARAIDALIEQLGVRTTIITDSIPMPAPHTRPVQVTRWASRPELILGHTSDFGKIQMPASFPAVLSQRLAEHGHDVVGLAAHVPHYLSDIDYPDAARALVESLRQVSGLALPSHALAMAAGAIRAQIASQVENSEELTQMLTALEEQYDSRTGQRAIAPTSVEVPSADDIGAEVEDFLRSMDSPRPDGPTVQSRTDVDSTPDPQPDDRDSSAPRRGHHGDNNKDEADTDPYRPRHCDDTWIDPTQGDGLDDTPDDPGDGQR